MSVWSLARNSDLANLCPPKKRISYVQIMINAVHIKHVQIQLLLINKKERWFCLSSTFFSPKVPFFCLFVFCFFTTYATALIMPWIFFSNANNVHSCIKMDFNSVGHFKSINPFQDMFYALLFLVDLWKALWLQP